ncbi:MAG TPA: D-aminoacyl-tRNA deacylase [Burkholderiales bacterium]|nr:D-aminoacyl-tRNA deacylase [Burkholderiales bacterium]
MIGLLQRVSEARVAVQGEVIAAIGRGLLVLVAVEAGDGRPQAERLLERLIGYRVFPDEQGRMNRSLADIGGGLLLVPQFTLAADTRKGTRPGFSTAAPPEAGRVLYEYLVERARAAHPQVASGRYGAHMLVTLTNDGPVTFWLRAPPPGSAATRPRDRTDFRL